MIADTDYIAIIACLLALLACALLFERTKIGNLFPASIGMLIGSIVLSNTGILPHQSEAYHQISATAIPVAVFLYLLRANLKEIVQQTGSMLRFYLLGALFTVLGIVIALLLIPGTPGGAKAAAVFVGMLVGGTVNVVAVAQAVEMDPTHLSAMLAANVPVASLYLMTVAVLGRIVLLKRLLPGPAAPAAVTSGGSAQPERLAVLDAAIEQQPVTAPKPAAAPAVKFDSVHVAILAASSLGAVSLVRHVLELYGLEQYLISVVSIVSLIVANTIPNLVKKLAGDREIALVLMLLFFGTIGVQVDIARFGGDALYYGAFYLLATAIHMVLLFFAARFMKGELQEVIVGSVAGIGGPTSAAATAATFGASHLVTPGILCALLGYAIATFIGLGLYAVLPH